MNDTFKHLINIIEPKIVDIQNLRVECRYLQSVIDTFEDIISCGEKSYFDIINYYDQDFIIRAIKINNDLSYNEVDKYITSRYLLKSRDNNIKELPQYKEAVSYIEHLFSYLSGLYSKTKDEYDDLLTLLEEKELYNKYYIILNRQNICIDEVEEFIMLLDLLKIDGQEKMNILYNAIKINLKRYLTTNKLIKDNFNLEYVEKILNRNTKLLENNYIFDNKYENDTYELYKEYGEKALYDKEKYLVNKIKQLYDTGEFKEINKYCDLYKANKLLIKEISKQKCLYSEKYSKKLLFLKNDNIIISKYLQEESEYKNYIYKNLLDLENNNNKIKLPDYIYNDMCFYTVDDFLVKTVYTYLNDGYVLVIDALTSNDNIKDIVLKYIELIKNNIKRLDELIDNNDRDNILKDVSIEDLLLNIDVSNIDMKMEEK